MDGFNQGLHHCIVGIHFAAAQLLVLGLLVELRLINQQGVNLNDVFGGQFKGRLTQINVLEIVKVFQNRFSYAEAFGSSGDSCKSSRTLFKRFWLTG